MGEHAKRRSFGQNIFRNLKTDDHKELPCQDTRKILAIMGALPVVFTPPYLPSLSLSKSSLVYCVVVYSVFTYAVIYSAMNDKRKYDEEDPSDKLRSRHLETILTMTPFVLGIYFWMDAPSLSSTFERYMDLQVKFRAATGKSLLNCRKSKERYSYWVVGSILVGLFTSINLISPPEFRFDLLSIVAHSYGNILAICATYMWVGLSWSIHDAAKATKMEFRKKLPFVAASNVYEFRILWLSMRSTLDSMGGLQCTAAMYSVSLLVSVFLLYTSAVLAQSGEVIPAVGHLIFAAYYVGLVAVTCSASQEVEEEMKCLVGEVLPKVPLTMYDTNTQREIIMLFLIESARPAVANFHGYSIVNKNLILAFFSNISTYIIVLVQFNESGDGFGM